MAQTCWHCVHGLPHKGYLGSYEQPPEPAFVECGCLGLTNDQVAACEALEWQEDRCPHVCGHYTSRPVGLCAYCNTLINAPLDTWSLWATTEERVPVCSPAHAAAVEAQFAQWAQARNES